MIGYKWSKNNPVVTTGRAGDYQRDGGGAPRLQGVHHPLLLRQVGEAQNNFSCAPQHPYCPPPRNILAFIPPNLISEYAPRLPSVNIEEL